MIKSCVISVVYVSCLFYAVTGIQTTSSNDLTQTSSCKITLEPRVGESSVRPSISKTNISLLLFLGFAGFSLLVAGGYKTVRRLVYHDDYSLDTVFDAGGRVTFSLTAVTVTSQLLWPADFLQSSTLMSKSGLGGSLWYCVGIVFGILAFPIISVFIKSRAPGAKTYPQIAHARFGTATHILFCIMALITALIYVTSVLLAGKASLEVLGKNMNNEYIFLAVAVLSGSYCMVGGLGTTFYISYFNTALTFLTVSIYILYTSIYPAQDIEKYSSIEAIYKAASCIEAPEGNANHSFLTFRSESGIIYGVVLAFMATASSFADQANWQSRIAAKPVQGTFGFLLAAVMWFVIPSTLSFTACMTYFAMSAENGTHLLTELEIEEGYITPYVMNTLLGDTGAYLLLTMLMMTLMATGSGEVMGLSSIIVYDIYKTYINPYRKGLTPTGCSLCGKERVLWSHSNDDKTSLCSCPSVIGCKHCERDIINRQKEGVDKVAYQCDIHGPYRRYEDGLMRYKSWCMVWIIILIVPYGMIISSTDMNLTWATLSTQVLTSPFMAPLFLTVTWSKTTAKGIISGTLVGGAVAISTMLTVATTYEDGLSKFFINTSQDYTLLAATCSGFVVSAIICVIVSFCTNTIQSEDDVEQEWAKTINIDNPINPFRQVYEAELAKVGCGDVITAATMKRVFRKAWLSATVGGVSGMVIFMIVLPAVTFSMDVLSLNQFKIWLRTFQYVCFAFTVLVIVCPPIEEGYQIWKQYKTNKYTSGLNDGHQESGEHM